MTRIVGPEHLMSDPGAVAAANWWVRNLQPIKTTLRVVFGAIWLIDGLLKFGPGVVSGFPDMVSGAADGQPAWLAPWFAFWSSQASANPSLWVYSTGALELSLGTCLILGLVRKLAYVGGIALSLLIWAVPEGFGGPYGPSSTDLGTGIVYAVVFLFLILVNAAFGPSRGSLDAVIERRWPRWAAVAEFGGPVASRPIVPRVGP